MRRMLMVVALVVSAAVSWPAQAQQVSAEKLFQQMEKKLHDAKTLQFGFDLKISARGEVMSTEKGNAVLGEGDKFRWDIDMDSGDKNITVVADGTKMFIKASGTAGIESRNCPKNGGAYFRGSLLRVGLLLGRDDGLKNDPATPTAPPATQRGPPLTGGGR